MSEKVDSSTSKEAEAKEAKAKESEAKEVEAKEMDDISKGRVSKPIPMHKPYQEGGGGYQLDG